MSDARRRIGAVGEDATARWYEERGYVVLARNWRVREGELDLVVRRSGTVVFCEVKTRSSDAFGAPIEAITATKQRRLRLLATRYLEQRPQPGCSLRFDVASVKPGGLGPIVDVVEGIF
jgi:putative endonuclease